ncbi:DASH family cryptochrome [Vibrio pacinii]|uniref:DASH family cryptochrome n=1 Tax=Vibrio pacinii TaxID=170674 RepID=UPI00068E81BE|nr:DASH family cryptochrome [Vibrio pacinii]
MLQQTIGLYWFSHDLRVEDNNLLALAAKEVDALICVYCPAAISPFLAQFSQQTQFGTEKQRFIDQSLHDLAFQLSQFDQQLMILNEDPFDALHELVSSAKVTHLYCNRHSGYNEQRCVQALQQTFPLLKVRQENVSSLFHAEQLPFDLDQLPNTFTQFRKRVESLELPACASVSSLPQAIELPFASLAPVKYPTNEQWLIGGSTAGLEHCRDYFATHNASQYKLTRNGLEGKDYSTKFSAWLALGCVSPRQIMRQLLSYQAQHGANDSTYWIYFELLWREFFYWYAIKQGQRLFVHSGLKTAAVSKHFNQARFDAWVQGRTGYAIVDACMRQLSQTGYMSNRGRQLVASCFIHELGLDWRYGAAYFETQLIDYDVASNWGNWQYLAGVGADTNPNRQFNLEKQTAMYDPHGVFIARWLETNNHGVTP